MWATTASNEISFCIAKTFSKLFSVIFFFKVKFINASGNRNVTLTMSHFCYDVQDDVTIEENIIFL